MNGWTQKKAPSPKILKNIIEKPEAYSEPPWTERAPLPKKGVEGKRFHRLHTI